MTIELAEDPITALPDYARIPIAFTVDRVLDVTARFDGPDGFVCSERCLDIPRPKSVTNEVWARRALEMSTPRGAGQTKQSRSEAEPQR